MPDGRRRDAICYRNLCLERPVVRSGLLKDVKPARAASKPVGAEP